MFSINYGQRSEPRTIVFLIYEPFGLGLGRFATDHSLTKVALRPLFVRVRHYAKLLAAASRPFTPHKYTNND